MPPAHQLLYYCTGPLLTPFIRAINLIPFPPAVAGKRVGLEVVAVTMPVSNNFALIDAGRFTDVIEDAL